ncbi:MAG TPA: hypothetical protein VFU88_14300 [Ktedonobacterales bacterium]|nr:hypothetical protein [Ktedonobacterales bacterium]
MPGTGSGRGSARHAITDLYDEERHTFLVHYPVLLIVALGLLGVGAFALTGLLGYSGGVRPVGADRAFAQPWPLYLWFAALLLTLLASIFRDESLRGRLILMLVTASIALLVVGVIRFQGVLPEVLQELLHQHRILTFLRTHALTYSLINFLLIAIFWADTVRRWIRRARGLPPYPRVTIGIESDADEEDMPSLQELISGDLIAGAVLVLMLSFFFSMPLVAQFSQIDPQLTTCTVSFCAGTPHDPPTLAFVDLIQALIYLPLGLIILAFSATVSGLGAVGGVGRPDLSAILPKPRLDTRTGAVPIAEDVATTVLDTLRAALDRRLRLLANNLALSLRMIGWPSLLLLASYGLTDLAVQIQGYLHSGKHLTDIAVYILPAAIWGMVAMLTVVGSAALMLFKWRVAENTLRFLGLVGFVVLLTFWIFSLALSGFNQLLVSTGAFADRQPFIPPSVPTYLSLAALLAFGAYFGMRGSRRRAKAEAAAVVGGDSTPQGQA